MSLSSLLVQRGIATMRQVEEALGRQVLYGGDLVTNLLEVARLDEGTLTLVLAESMGIQAAALGPLPAPEEEARALVPATLADARRLVPLAMEDGALVVVVFEPLSAEALREVAAAVGVPIVQRVAPFVRVREALSRVYGLSLERRIRRLIERIGSSDAPPRWTERPPPPSAPDLVAAMAVAHEGSPEVTETREGFLGASPLSNQPTPAPRRPTLLAGMGGGMPRAHTQTLGPAEFRGHTHTMPFTTGGEASADARLPEGLRRANTMKFPTIGTLGAGVGGAAPSAPTPPLPELRPASQPPRAVGTRAPSSFVQNVVPVVRPPRRRRGPLTTDQAKRELDEATDRDTILDLFFDFSRQYFDYSALFLVHGDIAEGRDAYGDGAPREKVSGIGVPLDLDSFLAQAREHRAPVHVAPSDDRLDPVLLADLQRTTKAEILVVPVVVGKRVVALFYGDSGDAGIDPASAREVAPFAHLVAQAFARVIRQKKLQGALTQVAQAHRAEGAGDDPSRNERSTVKAEEPLPVAEAKAPEAAAPADNAPPSEATATAEPQELSMSLLVDDHAVSRPPPGAPFVGLAPAEKSERTGDDSLTPMNAGALPDAANVVVPARRPPSPRSDAPSRELPTIMVDVEQELGALVQRVLTTADDAAEAELLRQGSAAMPAILARFPGPITVERARAMEGALRAAECGPILRLIARQRRAALPFVLPLVADPDRDRRFWATLLLAELPYAEAAEPLVPRLFDGDASVRRVARLAARAVGEPSALALVDKTRAELRDTNTPSARRAEILETLGELRARASVPVLIEALGDGHPAPVQAARRGLVTVTRHDLGGDRKKWQQWWNVNAGRHRIEWLIDALTSEVPALRREAGEELKALTKEYFGYYGDLPKKERERAQQRYRDWWAVEGRVRFARG